MARLEFIFVYNLNSLDRADLIVSGSFLPPYIRQGKYN